MIRHEIPHPEINRIADQYVRLCLALDRHDPGFVDFYCGPKDLRPEAAESKSLQQIYRLVSSLEEELRQLNPAGWDEPFQQRRNFLRRRLASLTARLHLLQGGTMNFDEESDFIYGAICPSFPEPYFKKILDEISSLLPGSGSVQERLERLRSQFQVPPEKLDAVLQAAIAEARVRTTQCVPLPPGEKFQVEYVTAKPWIAYNWFQGKSRSLIQVNTDLPVSLEWIILLACHEGYPGHHTFFCLREQEYYRQRGWIEAALCPLYGPDALVAEGMANFGVRVVFPTLEERLRFEKEELCPLAGIDPENLELYDHVLELAAKLGYAEVEGARHYLAGLKDREETVQWLVRYRLYPQEIARKQVEFIEGYRAYVINYSLGEDLIKSYVERKGGTSSSPVLRWHIYGELLGSFILPGDLQG